MCQDVRIFLIFAFVYGARGLRPSSTIRFLEKATSYGSFSTITLKCLGIEITHLYSQVERSRRFGHIWDEEVSSQSNRKRDNSVYDEQPRYPHSTSCTQKPAICQGTNHCQPA